jgi:putative OPT family oligopeptide transporter
MSSVADGVFRRNLPWAMIWIGTGIAAAIIALDQWLKARRSDFRTPVLAVAVGIYLPLELTVPIFLGGVIAWAAGRAVRRRHSGDRERLDEAVAASERQGLLFASGLITGEALLGILLAIPFAAAQSTDVLAIAPPGFEAVAGPLGLLAFGAFCVWLYRVARA